MNDLPNIMLAAVPAFVLLIAVEALYSARRQRGLYRTSDAVANVVLALGNFAVATLFAGLVLLVYSWVYTHRLFTLPTDAWWV